MLKAPLAVTTLKLFVISVKSSPISGGVYFSGNKCLDNNNPLFHRNVDHQYLSRDILNLYTVKKLAPVTALLFSILLKTCYLHKIILQENLYLRINISKPKINKLYEAVLLVVMAGDFGLFLCPH